MESGKGRHSDMKWMTVIFIALGASAAQEYSLGEVKAAYLLNFGRFVEWPSQALESSSDHFNLCLMGKSLIDEQLAKELQKEKVKDRPVKIIRVPADTSLQDCQIVYISTEPSEEIQEILDHLKNRPILTVGDSSDFTSQGGMIQFVKEEKHLRFKVNKTATERSGLTISAKLLQIAETVK